MLIVARAWVHWVGRYSAAQEAQFTLFVENALPPGQVLSYGRACHHYLLRSHSQFQLGEEGWLDVRPMLYSQRHCRLPCKCDFTRCANSSGTHTLAGLSH